MDVDAGTADEEAGVAGEALGDNTGGGGDAVEVDVGSEFDVDVGVVGELDVGGLSELDVNVGVVGELDVGGVGEIDVVSEAESVNTA